MKKLFLTLLLVFCFIGTSFAKTYNIKSNNDTLKLKENDIAIIELPENPSTGFNWQFLSTDENVIKIINKTIIYPKRPKGQPPLCGQGGTAVYKIKAQGKGNAQIKGVYSRPWEKIPPDREYNLDVVVE